MFKTRSIAIKHVNSSFYFKGQHEIALHMAMNLSSIQTFSLVTAWTSFEVSYETAVCSSKRRQTSNFGNLKRNLYLD